MKYDRNSTRKTTICYPRKSQKCKKLLFWGVILGPGNQCGIQWIFKILWISESLSFYLLVKNSFNFKLGFLTYFEYTSGGIIRKNILHSDHHSIRWYWCKKWHSCNKNHLFFAKKSPRSTRFHELTPKLLSILTGLILHTCGG